MASLHLGSSDFEVSCAVTVAHTEAKCKILVHCIPRLKINVESKTAQT